MKIKTEDWEMKKIRYGYLNRGSGLTVINGWKLYDEPLPRIQFGFFGTLKTTDEIGELTWGNEEPHHKRGFSREELFAWLHDNIGMWCWGDISAQRRACNHPIEYG